jgi:hypothetical protein
MGRPCIFCCILLIASFGHSEAQVTTGSIVGTVKDTSRGVLPGVTVTAVNVDTTFTRSETSNERGEYSLQFLPPGSHCVEAELTGFKRFVQTGVEIELARAARIDPVLERLRDVDDDTVETVDDMLEDMKQAPPLETSPRPVIDVFRKQMRSRRSGKAAPRSWTGWPRMLGRGRDFLSPS